MLSDERTVGIVRGIVWWEDDWDCVGCCPAGLVAERDGLVVADCDDCEGIFWREDC